MEHPRRSALVALYVAIGLAVAFMLWAVWSVGTSAWSYGPGMMGLGWVWMLIPLGLMVWMMAMMMRGAGRGGHAGHGCHVGHGEHRPTEDAGAVLERRYAAGEITRDEYLRIREDLGRGR